MSLRRDGFWKEALHWGLGYSSRRLVRYHPGREHGGVEAGTGTVIRAISRSAGSRDGGGKQERSGLGARVLLTYGLSTEGF